MKRQAWFLLLKALLVACILLVSLSCGHKGSRSTQSGTSGLAAPKPTKVVLLQDVLRGIDATPTPKGVSAQLWATLVSELKKQLIARAGGSKTISIAPTGLANAVSDLAAVSNGAGTQATLTWTEKLAGDYNNDGVVDITDLQPLALYYLQRIDTGADDAHRLVNGDADPEINIADLGAVANNYMAKVEGYQIWRGSYNGTSTNWEATFRPNIDNPANTSFSADRPSPPPVSARPPFAYADDISALADKTTVRYKVVPYGDGAAGDDSNEAAMPPPNGAGLADSAWPKFHANSRNTGLSPYVAAQTKHLKWSYATGGAVQSSPAIGSDGTVYVGSNNGEVYALHPDGSLKWWYGTGYWVGSSPAIGADGTVYIRSDDRSVYALDPSGGALRWSHPTGTGYYVGGSPAVGADGTVYVGSYETVYALNPVDGSIKWSHSTANVVRSSPAIGADGTVYVGSDDQRVYALNPADGSVKWSHFTGGYVRSSPSIGADGTIYVGSDDDSVYALNPADGNAKWSHSTGSPVESSPAVGADGTVYVGNGNGSICALNPSDGSAKWTYATGNSVNSSPAIGADGTVYVGSNDGSVYALYPASGMVKWSYATGGPVQSSPAIGADGTVYVGSDDGSLYAFTGVSTHSVSGTVLQSGVGLAGVQMTLTPDGLTAMTQADGSYSITAVADGSYTLTPSKVGFVFSPTSKPVTVSGADVIGQDFTPSPLHSVSGTVTSSGVGLHGVTMTLYPGGLNATTQTDGTYAITGVGDGSYTLTPSLSDYAFAPANRSVSVAGADVTAQDFVGSSHLITKIYIQVNGVDAGNSTASGMAFVEPNSQPTFTLYQVDDYDSTTGTTTTRDAAASEKADTTWTSSDPASVPMGTPNTGDQTSPGVTNAPPAQATVTASYYGSASTNPPGPPPLGQTSIVAQCFVVVGAYSISGTIQESGVGLPGAVVTVTPSRLTATTQPDGTYVIGPALVNGKYTVVPRKQGYSFAPHTASATIAGADAGGVDFTATGGITDPPWSKFHCNSRNTGLSPYVGAQTNHIKWARATLGYYVYSSPAIGTDGTIYIGGWNGNVYALNPPDGSIKWAHFAGSFLYSSPAIGVDGTVYIGSEDSKVYALNPADGSVKWTRATGSYVDSSPAIGADGTVYFGSGDNNVYALNPADGSVKWSFATGYGVRSSPAIGGDGTVYVGSYDNNVYALNPSDGSVKWTRATGSYVDSSPAIGADGTVYFGSGDDNVYALNPADGSVKWTRATGSYVDSSPTIGVDGTVYIGSSDRNVYALNPADGSVKWSYLTGGGVGSSPAIGADGTVYVGSCDYNVYALNPADGSVKWTSATGNYVESSPAIGADGTVYIGSDDGKVYAFGP